MIAKLFSSKLSQSTAAAFCFSGLNCNGLNYNGLKGKMQGLISPCRPIGTGATMSHLGKKWSTGRLLEALKTEDGWNNLLVFDGLCSTNR
ncbi:MAG: hypothetical protein IJC96_04160, partial [Clostridia bacterium]|nr:hypothetical protein [Clostridia bacterium]